MTAVAQKTVLTGCLAPIDRGGLEQLIAKIVVCSDVALRTATRVCSPEVKGAHHPSTKTSRPSFHTIEEVAIAQEQTHEAHKIIAAPPTVSKRFGRADAAVGRDGSVEARVDYDDFRAWQSGIDFTEFDFSEGVDQPQMPLT